MSKIILGFTGQIASGKDVCKKYLEEKYGASSYRFSTILRDILNRLYLPISRDNMQNLSLSIRTTFGGHILAKVITEDAKNDNKDTIVIDGIRRLDDIITLKDLPNFYLISVVATKEIRHKRVVSRNENIGDNNKTFEEFLEDEKKEAESEIPTVMSQAKYQLNNNGTLDELYQQLDNIISEIKK